MDKFSPIAAIKTGWKCAKEHFIVSLGVLMAYGVVTAILSMFPLNSVVGTVAQLLNMVVSLIWSMGILRLAINVVDGDAPRFSVFKEVLPRLLHYIVLSVLIYVVVLIPVFVIMCIGAATCSVSLTTLSAFDITAISTMSLWVILSFVPVIYIALRLSFAPYLLIDRGCGPIESLKMSWKASYPLQGRLFVFFLLSLLVFIVGLLCFFVGAIFSTIIVMYAQAALYRQAFSAGIQDPLLVEDTNVVVS